MTGRELIIYILQNNLEDKPVFENGEFLGFLTVDKAAAKLNVGVETMKTWLELGWIEGIEFEDMVFVPANIERPQLCIRYAWEREK